MVNIPISWSFYPPGLCHLYDFLLVRPLLRDLGGGLRERRNDMKVVPLVEYYMVYGPVMERLGSPEISSVERLMNEFEAHEGGELRFVQRYRGIAGKTENRLIRFLLQLIIADEEKHHAVTHAIVSTLKGDLTWTRPGDAIRGLYDLGEERDELLGLTEDFIRLEKEGIKEYKALMEESKGYYRGLFVLLLQAMVRDSEKHVEILKFLQKTLKED